MKIIHFRNTDLLSSRVPIRNKKPQAPPKVAKTPLEKETGLPPPPSSPNAPPLSPIIDPLTSSVQLPAMDLNPLQYLPSVGMDGNIEGNNDWLGQGVINEDGKWVTENDNSDSSLFSENEVFDNGNDILKR